MHQLTTVEWLALLFGALLVIGRGYRLLKPKATLALGARLLKNESTSRALAVVFLAVSAVVFYLLGTATSFATVVAGYFGSVLLVAAWYLWHTDFLAAELKVTQARGVPWFRNWAAFSVLIGLLVIAAVLLLRA